ncbi:hypothetical protein [Streptomyces sp. NPDC097640]|uniref:hypothetical protein n=1 Tax=Streptomyces sp. NPDC097640 TaxID=3157229 RepID=UPI0033260FD9
MSRFPLRTVALRGAYGLIGAVLAATAVASVPVQADSVRATSQTVTETGRTGGDTVRGARVTRRQIIQRAQAWVDRKVPYSANGTRAPFSWWPDEATGWSYRQDCSGYVSMAWQLGSSLSTRSLPSVSTAIRIGDLKPGDILNSPQHVVIFGGWIDQKRGTFSYYQQSSRSRPTSKDVGNLTSGRLAGHPLSSYTARRYLHVVDSPAPATPPAPKASRTPTAPSRTPAPAATAQSPKAAPSKRNPAAAKPRTSARTTALVSLAGHSRLYALAADHSAVYEWRGGQGGWRRIGGPAGEIYAGELGLFATNPDDGRIYKYNGRPHSWTRIGGRGATFAVTSNRLYGLSPDHSAVYQWTGRGTAWTRVGGPAEDIYAGKLGLFATDPDTGDLHRYGARPGQWSRIGGPGGSFAIAGNRLYGLSPDRGAVYQWSGHGTAWKHVGGPAGEIYGGGAGLFATDPDTGRIYAYENRPHSWTKVGGPGTTFAVAGNRLYGLSPDRTAVFQWTGHGTAWARIGAPAAR